MAEINSIDKTRQDEDSSLPSICQSRFLGSLYNRGQGFAGAVWDKNYISPTLTTMQGGGREPMIITCKLDKMPDGKLTSLDNAKICDIETETTSTITARYTKGIGAHKDNMCLEIKKVGQISNDGSQCGTVVSEEGLFPTISAGTHGYANAHIATHYRIRKLTPKECWRLMGYTDEDYEKASRVNSNTQLYKQAGNAIVKQVLMAIFSQLNIKGVKAWNDMTETEKRDIIKKTTMAGE